MDFKVPKHNTPAATLIRNYQNRKSGKVTVSRREIQQRFNGMEWRHQKKILLAFINASASDREWASRKMFAFWDNSFIPVVKTLWEQYHEISLSWLILRYFPKEYLKDNMGSLSKGRNYYYLCQRLIDEEDFCVDKKRLYESDMIQLFKIMKTPVSDDAIIEVFFSMVAKICKGVYKSSHMYNWDIDDDGHSELSILSNRKVSNILFDIEYGLGRRTLADRIRTWSSKVMQEAKESDQYRMILQMNSQGHNSQHEYLSLIKKYCLKHLYLDETGVEEADFELQSSQMYGKKIDLTTLHSILYNMQMANPAIYKLMNSFSLEIVVPLPF